jgi:tetratricopeptide (TPR) repeat protein
MGVKKRVPKKSLIKKEVEEIIPLGKRFVDFFTNNLKESISVLCVFLIIVAFIFFWNLYSTSLEKKSLVIFTDAFQYYSSAVEKGNPADYQTAALKLNDLINKYPKTSIGKISLLYLGNCYFWLKDYHNADKYYKLFLDNSSKKEKFLRKFSYEGLGYASEQSGKYDQAVEYFKKATEEEVVFNDIGLMNLARAYEEVNRKDKAIEIYNKVIKDYPQSESSSTAKEKLFLLRTNLVK